MHSIFRFSISRSCLSKERSVRLRESYCWKEESKNCRWMPLHSRYRLLEILVHLSFFFQFSHDINTSQDHLQEAQSELSYLHIWLKGIQAQCIQYMPEGGDPELCDAMQRWMDQYHELQRKMDRLRDKRLEQRRQEAAEYRLLPSPLTSSSGDNAAAGSSSRGEGETRQIVEVWDRIHDARGEGSEEWCVLGTSGPHRDSNYLPRGNERGDTYCIGLPNCILCRMRKYGS